MRTDPGTHAWTPTRAALAGLVAVVVAPLLAAVVGVLPLRG